MSAFNLLPVEEKKMVRSDYSYRRMIVALVDLSALILIAGVFLAPAYIVSHFRLKDVAQTAEILESNIALKKRADLGEIAAAMNKKVGALLAAKDTKMSAYVAGIERHRSPEIKISSFRIAFTEKEKKAAIAIRGTAATREALLAFTTRLKSDPEYASVDLPISNFAEERNIGFSLTITMK